MTSSNPLNEKTNTMVPASPLIHPGNLETDLFSFLKRRRVTNFIKPMDIVKFNSMAKVFKQSFIVENRETSSLQMVEGRMCVW